MSTRGVIAKREGDGWRGVYQHSGSYPTWLGNALWADLHGGCGSVTPQAFVQKEIDGHLGGWSAWPDSCYCHSSEWEARDNSDMVTTERTVDWLHIEWIYVIDPEALTFAVICGQIRRLGAHLKQSASGRSWARDNYGCELLAVFPLDGPEPDWQDLENAGGERRDRAEQSAGASVSGIGS